MMALHVFVETGFLVKGLTADGVVILASLGRGCGRLHRNTALPHQIGTQNLAWRQRFWMMVLLVSVKTGLLVKDLMAYGALVLRSLGRGCGVWGHVNTALPLEFGIQRFWVMVPHVYVETDLLVGVTTNGTDTLADPEVLENVHVEMTAERPPTERTRALCLEPRPAPMRPQHRPVAVPPAARPAREPLLRGTMDRDQVSFQAAPVRVPLAAALTEVGPVLCGVEGPLVAPELRKGQQPVRAEPTGVRPETSIGVGVEANQVLTEQTSTLERRVADCTPASDPIRVGLPLTRLGRSSDRGRDRLSAFPGFMIC